MDQTPTINQSDNNPWDFLTHHSHQYDNHNQNGHHQQQDLLLESLNLNSEDLGGMLNSNGSQSEFVVGDLINTTLSSTNPIQLQNADETLKFTNSNLTLANHSVSIFKKSSNINSVVSFVVFKVRGFL